jgi:hypothetical protein
LREITGVKKIGLMVALQITTVSVAWGAVWRVTPRIELKETYTDNVTLAPAGEEEWDLVTQINPGVSINGTGRRVRLNLNYRLQTLFYAQDSDRDNVFHQLGANAGVELVKERFFVNVRANVSQTNLFNTGRVARDNISGAGDRTDTASVEVEPIWRERWGGYADTELIYRGRNLRVDTDRISDGPSHQVDFRARNGRRLTQLTWNVDAEYRREERDDPEDDFERSRVEGETRFRVTRELYILGVAGREESDFRSTRSLTDGNFWSLGAGWSPSRRFTIEGGKGQNNEFVNVSITPSRRSTLEVRYRDRSVGSNPGRVYAGRLSYRTRKARLSGSYNEEATTTQEVLEGVRAFPSQNPFGETVLDPVGAILCRPDRVSTPTLTDEVFVRKRFALFGGVMSGLCSRKQVMRTRASALARVGHGASSGRRVSPRSSNSIILIFGTATRWKTRPMTAVSESRLGTPSGGGSTDRSSTVSVGASPRMRSSALMKTGWKRGSP